MSFRQLTRKRTLRKLLFMRINSAVYLFVLPPYAVKKPGHLEDYLKEEKKPMMIHVKVL
jgi:hypothetical protein